MAGDAVFRDATDEASSRSSDYLPIVAQHHQIPSDTDIMVRLLGFYALGANSDVQRRSVGSLG